jgi:hypothetical protein
VLIATISAGGQVSTERYSVAVSTICDLAIDISGCSNKQQVRERVAEALRGRNGYARVTLVGEMAPEVDLCVADFEDLIQTLDSPPVVRLQSVRVAYDLAEIAQELTVRGQFIRDVQASVSDPEERQRVIVTGLRALSGRHDLEAL